MTSVNHSHKEGEATAACKGNVNASEKPGPSLPAAAAEISRDRRVWKLCRQRCPCRLRTQESGSILNSHQPLASSSKGSILQNMGSIPWKLIQLNGRLSSVEDTLCFQQAFNSQVSSALSLSITPLVLLTKFSPEERHLMHI